MEYMYQLVAFFLGLRIILLYNKLEGLVVYDRTTYQTGSSTPTNIHRVTFSPTSAPTGTWTRYVSQSGSTVTIEVS